MASINKLSIRGIRAFSPDDQEQVIEFYFPVTVIVGANGCGKTTIIESLKYAVTGSLPPGNRSGQAFVHDPKSIGQSTVKANIKLRFTNRAGQQMVVVRSMEVAQKKTAMSFKALDGILRTTDSKTGEKVSMSHKCTELDRQIPMLLGVSKPILDNVVFCHQEDSSWPLMEGAVLKKKFDDIFDSTRYAKALKAIYETKKEYNAIAKELKAELAGLSSHKHAAKGFREELEEQAEELEELEENVRGLTEEMREVQEEIKRNEAIAEEVEEQKLIIEEKQTELTRQQSVLAAHKSMLQDDLTSKHSSRELKEMLRDFDTQMSAQIEKKRDLQRDHEAAETAIQQIRDQDKSLREQIGKLQAEKAAQEERMQRRLAKMDAFCETYGILLPTTQTQNMSFTQGSVADSVTTTTGGSSQEVAVDISPQDIIAFFKTVDDKEAELKQTLSNYRADSQRRGDEIQEDLNEMSAKVKGAELELKKLEEEQTSATAEIETLNTQVGTQSTRTRQADIDDAEKRMKQFIKERDKASEDTSLKNIPLEIRSMEAKIDVLKRDIEYDNQALGELRENSDAQNSISVLKEQAEAEFANLRESVNDQSYLGQKYAVPIPTMPADGADPSGNDLVDSVQTFLDNVTDKNESTLRDLDKAKDELVSKQRVVSEKSALLSHSKQNLASLRSKLDALGGENGSVSKFQRTVGAIRQYEQSSNITPVLQGSDPQAVMAHLGSKLEDIETNASGSIQPQVLADILDSIYEMSAVEDDDGSKKIQCPCCVRPFTGMEDFSKFRESLDRLKDIETSELLRANRQEVEKSNAAKAQYKRWRKIVSETMHDVMDWTRMTTEAKDTEVTIADIERELNSCQKEVSTLEETTKDLQASTADLRNLVEAAKRWTDDAARLSRKKEQIRQKKTDLELATGSFLGEARDLQTVENDLKRRQAEKEELGSKINELNRKMTQLNQKIANLSKQATECEKLYRDRQEKYNQEQSSTIRKNELQERFKVLGDEILDLKDTLRSFTAKERSKKGDRDRFRNSTNDEIQGQSDNLRKFEREVNSLRQIQGEIDAYANSSKEEEFDRINAKLSTLSRKLEAKKTEREQIMPKLRSINREIGDQETHKKLIEDNLKLIGYKDAIARLEDEVNQMLADVEKVDGFDTFEQALEDCQKKLGDLTQRRSHHEGRRGAFAEQIHLLKRKLKTKEYNRIDERHRVAVIKHETTTIAVADLDKYHTALDNALLRYHGIKIADINRIIRELWNLTYKGEDITTIEIVSGQEKAAKKSYNYRVVMSKGGAKLDMRGRCSAGQRVLASIVIRLALAETFCVNCGCIALDEPTVNLDYNNKRGLAIALAQIIASRAQQSNFQLIVITHDEEFVAMMKTELASQSGFSMPEKYFQVRREEAADGKHYSKIDAIDWDELV